METKIYQSIDVRKEAGVAATLLWLLLLQLVALRLGAAGNPELQTSLDSLEP